MAETHNHTPRDHYTPTGPSDTPDVSGYLSQDTHGDINTFMSEDGRGMETKLWVVSAMAPEEIWEEKNQFHTTVQVFDNHINAKKYFNELLVMNGYDETELDSPEDDWAYKGAAIPQPMIDGEDLFIEIAMKELSMGYDNGEVYSSEEGSAPVQDPMEFGEMANWTPLDGSEGLKRKRAENMMQIIEGEVHCGRCDKNVENDPVYAELTLKCNGCGHILYHDDSDGPYDVADYFGAETFEADFNYYYNISDKSRGMEILDRLRTMNPETKSKALDWLIDNGFLHSEEVFNSAYINAMGDALYITSEEDDYDDYDAESRVCSECQIYGYWDDNPVCPMCRTKNAESFAAEYSGPATLSSALSGARKTGRNGKHLTIVQRLVAKYGIDKGVKIYKHFGIKQKRASPKVRGKTRGTKSGPRRYSEGRVGGAGRSQVYQKGDRTGSWTPSGGHTTRFANSGKAWYQERGLGTPVAGPIPDTDLAGKSMGEKFRGSFVNPHGIVGYPFVPAQQRERKSKK